MRYIAIDGILYSKEEYARIRQRLLAQDEAGARVIMARVLAAHARRMRPARLRRHHGRPA